jgi:hypothetical protein
MTIEELVAAGLLVDPVVEGAENAAPVKTPALLAAPGVAKTGKFNQMTTKISGMWTPVSVIWLKEGLPDRCHPLLPSGSPRSQPI